MLQGMADRIAETALDESEGNPRAQTFGYICRRCMRCCYHKGIQVNPYEVARLARRLGQTTTEFRAAWTRDGAGTMLQQTNTGACVFLGSGGCTVHTDRPLVCRLYPLGRRLTPEGVESFVQLEGHPQSAGEFNKDGTVERFLESQDAEPFITAADEYYHWYCAAHARLCTEISSESTDGPAGTNEAAAADLLDMDAAIAIHCTATGIAEPTVTEERKKLHLAFLYERLAKYETGGRHEQTEGDTTAKR